MAMEKMILITFLFISKATRNDADCPPESVIYPCSCAEENYEFKVKCRHEDIEKIGEALTYLAENEYICKSLLVSNSRVKVLDSSLLKNIESERIYLDLPSLNTVDESTFKGHGKHLKSLKFLRTNMSKVPVEAFRSLNQMNVFSFSDSRNIKRIYEYFNKISVISTRVISVYLVKNQIYYIENRAFVNFFHLRNLNLRNNKLNTLNAGSLPVDLSKLYILDLANNEIDEIPWKIIRKVSHRTVLILSRNNIRYIDISTVSTLIENQVVVFLYNNRLVCECNVLPLVRYKVAGMELLAKGGTCYRPLNLRGRNLTSLDISELDDCLKQ